MWPGAQGNSSQSTQRLPGRIYQNHSSIATSEQAMPLPWDSQPPARETRAVHTADIHISEPTGTDIWVDVRIGMGKPDCCIPKELARMEQEKRREYGLGPSNPSTLFDGVVPVIFEQHGCPSPCAITLLHHILRRRVAKLEQASHLTHGVAWMIAARKFFAPISCILLVMHHQMFQECCPIVQTPDKRTDSHGLLISLLAASFPRGSLARC